MNWRDLTDPPKQPTPVLVAAQRNGEESVLLGAYDFKDGGFFCSQTGLRLITLKDERAWWIDESVLFDVVPLPSRERAPAC